MGIFDKAKDLAADHPDQANQAIDKAGDAFDAKTGGKHAEHVDKAQDLARDHVAGMGNSATPGEAPPEAPVGEQPVNGSEDAIPGRDEFNEDGPVQ